MYTGSYQLIGNELSFFTRKLEAQLRAQRLSWTYLYKTEERRAELESRAGTHFIPLLLTPEKWLLNDTIAIGPFLNERHRNHPVIPNTPLQRASCFILEDAFNHWLGRFCVHSRWCYPENVDWVGPRFGANIMLDRSVDLPFTQEELERLAPIGPMMCESFGRQACEVNGVGADRAGMVQQDFQNLLSALAEHLQTARFLLGDRPCLADFALAGACKAHFLTDPEPLSWLGHHSTWLSLYTERLFSDFPAPCGDWLPDDQLDTTLSPLLDYFQHSYFTAATVNIAGNSAGERFYEVDFGLGPVTARTQKRLNVARLHVRDELQKIAAMENKDVQATYGSRNILDYYFNP